jgi:hypothetical protein
VPFQNGVAGALYKPDSGPAPHVGIVVMHREGNYLRHIACTEFSKRGFLVLCMNSRFHNNESAVDWELIPLDVAQGVNYLKNVQRMTKIVLFGNSGGGVTMSFYQAVAENGPAVCQGPSKLMQCGNNLAGLAPADGIILVDERHQELFRLRREVDPGEVLTLPDHWQTPVGLATLKGWSSSGIRGKRRRISASTKFPLLRRPPSLAIFLAPRPLTRSTRLGSIATSQLGCRAGVAC